MNLLFQVFALSVVLLSVHGDLLVNRCGGGPSYWCKNFNTALECGKISECKKGVWASPKENNEVCDLCKDAVEAMSGYIGKNHTKQMVEAALLKLCSDVPIKELNDECTEAITKNYDMLYTEIVDLIENGDLVCGALGLCSASTENRHIDMLIKNLPAQFKDALDNNQLPVASVHLIDDTVNTKDEGCTDCQAFLGDVRKVLKSDKSLIGQWKELARMECNALGPRLNLICQDHMEEAIASLVHDVNGDGDMVKICGKINMCHFKSHKMEGNDMCADCKNFIEDWQTMIMKNNTLVEELVKEVSEFYCLQKPQFLRKRCSRYVAMALKIALNRIMQKTPGEICEAIDFCSAPELLTENRILSLIQQKFMTTNGDHCQDCTALLTDLQGLAKNNKSFASDLTALLEKQCDQLGFLLSGLCRKQIPTAVSTLIPQFEVANVGDLCTTILMCKSPPVTPAKGGDVCQDCINFAQDWQLTLAHNETFVDNLLDKAALTYCNQLPFFVRDKCDDVAKQGILTLLEYVKKTEASIICTKVDLCGDISGRKLLLSDAPQSKPVQVQKKGSVGGFSKASKKKSMTANGDYCQDCTALLTDLQGLARNNKSFVSDLTTLLEKQCDQLGFILSGLCRKQIPPAVTSFLPQFEVADVGVLCTTILMCKSPPVKPAKGGDVCQDCINFAQDWQVTLVHNETFVDNLLDKAALAHCNQLPSFLRAKCDDVAKQLILNLLEYVKKTEVSIICTKVDLCGDISGRKLLLSDAPQSKPVQMQKKGSVGGFSKASKKVKGPVTCVLCRLVIHELDKLLEGNRTEVAIQKALDKVCSILPKEVSHDCTYFVDKYGKDVIDLLIDETESGVICSRLFLCAADPRAPRKEVAPCELCTMLVKEVDVMVQTNVSMDVIVGKLDAMCVVLPSVFAQDCKDAIQNIVQSLKHGETPKRVCADYHFCSAQSRSVHPAIMRMFTNVIHEHLRQKPKQDDVGCTLCTFGFKELETLLKTYNLTKKEVVNDLDLVCSFLPGSYEKKCTDTVDNYVGIIIQALINGTSPRELCAAFGVCPAKTISLDPTTACDLCVVIGEELDHLLTKNSTEKDIAHALDKVCSILPSYLANDCKALIDNYSKKMINALVNGVRPEILCSTIGLCRSKQQVPKVSSISCTICELVCSELEGLLKENSTEAEIERALDKVCALLPTAYKERCDQFIAKYGDPILKLLVDLVPPREVCGILGLCPQKKVKGMSLCSICEAIAGELDQKLSDKPTQKEVENALEKICHLVTGQLRDECDDFIKINAPAIMDLLANDVAPLTICPELHMCPKKKKVVKSTGTVCDVCKIVIDFLDQELAANATRADIERELDVLCAKLPSELKSACDDIVKQYTPEILDLAGHIFDPDYVCIHLKLCGEIKKPRQVVKSTGTLCDVCKIVIDFLDQELETNATRADIERALDTLCAKLPSDLTSACDDIVKQYTPEILDLADHIFDPDYVCVHLDLCGNAKKPGLVGGNPCTYGPSYWCKNEQSAKECHALDHCRLHVWN